MAFRKLFAYASAAPKPAGVVVSRTSRCLPEILSIQSSCACFAGLKPGDADCAFASETPEPSALPATVTPAPRRVRNERRSVLISTSRQHGITQAMLRNDDPGTRMHDNSARRGSRGRLSSDARDEDVERRSAACR